MWVIGNSFKYETMIFNTMYYLGTKTEVGAGQQVILARQEVNRLTLSYQQAPTSFKANQLASAKIRLQTVQQNYNDLKQSRIRK